MMVVFLTSHKSLFTIVILQFIFKVGHSQTYCSYRVPVPDLDVCDASGGLEENISSAVYETKGNVDGMQDYQEENFNLMDQQINTIVSQRDQVDTNILDITEELNTLKRSLGGIGTTQAQLHGSTQTSHQRGKRAVASSSQLLNDLNVAKQSFQQTVISLEGKLQNLAKQVENNEKQNAAIDKSYQTQLAKNQQEILAAEAQLTTITNTIQQIGTGSSGLSSTTVAGSSKLTQDVADLVVDGRVAEQTAERQIDNFDKQLRILDATENQIQTDIQTTRSSLNNTTPRIKQAEQDALAVTQSQEIFGWEVGNTTTRFANITSDVTQARNDLAQVGSDVLQLIMNQTSFTQDLTSFRHKVDAVQSLVTYSQAISVSQSTDILNMRKTLMDDINVLRYAFGATTTPP